MAIQRPRFYEGQVLGATDLTAGQDYHRDQLARHHRYAHSWGIVDGFLLEGVPTPTQEGFSAIRLTPGVVIDSAGREVVVPEESQLTGADFRQVVRSASAADAWYPIFLSGHDNTAGQRTIAGCDSSEPNRVTEDFVLTFGRAGEDENNDALPPPGLAGTDPAATRRVRLGYVQWDSAAERFTTLWPDPKKPGLAPAGVTPLRYLGARAARIDSPGDTLTLGVAGAATGTIALQLQKAGDQTNRLSVGVIDGAGGFTEKLTIDNQGNLTTKGIVDGKIRGTSTADKIEGIDGKLDLSSGPVATVGTTTLQLRSETGQAPAQINLAVSREGADQSVEPVDVIHMGMSDTGAFLELKDGDFLTLAAGGSADQRSKLSLGEGTLLYAVGGAEGEVLAASSAGVRLKTAYGQGSIEVRSNVQGGTWLKVDQGALTLGRTDLQGGNNPSIDKVFLKFDHNAALIEAGRLPGTTFIASGEYTNGENVELPSVPAYAQSQVGTIIHVTPLVPEKPVEPGDWSLYSVTECKVDGDPLTLKCKVTWFDFSPLIAQQPALPTKLEKDGRALCTVIMHVPHTP